MSSKDELPASPVAKRLREERTRLGLSQAAFAECGGVSKVSQFNYESGRRKPGADYLAAVATLGVDVYYVLTGRSARQSSAWLSAAEVTLLDNYRQSSPERRKSLDELAAALAGLSTGERVRKGKGKKE